jgi:hypothetical protein
MTPRGGPRENQTGRPRRSEPKSKLVWCGQMSEADRTLIMSLTPDERQAALLAAARVKLLARV